jgi:hypothetical protein
VTVRVEDTSKGIHIHDEPSKEFKIVLAIIIFAVCFSLGYIVDRLLEGAL